MVLNRLRGVLGMVSSLLALRLVPFELDALLGGVSGDDEATAGVVFDEALPAPAFFERSMFDCQYFCPSVPVSW